MRRLFWFFYQSIFPIGTEKKGEALRVEIAHKNEGRDEIQNPPRPGEQNRPATRFPNTNGHTNTKAKPSKETFTHFLKILSSDGRQGPLKLDLSVDDVLTSSWPAWPHYRPWLPVPSSNPEPTTFFFGLPFSPSLLSSLPFVPLPVHATHQLWCTTPSLCSGGCVSSTTTT